MKTTRKKFGIEMSPELHKRLRALANDREIKLYEATEEAIEAYVGAKSLEPACEVPRRLQGYLSKLSKILASGDELAIDAVTKNVDLFLDRLRPGGRKHS